MSTSNSLKKRGAVFVRSHPGQRRASRRKRENRNLKICGLADEARVLGIPIWLLQFKKRCEEAKVSAQHQREYARQQLLAQREAERRVSRPYGYHY